MRKSSYGISCLSPLSLFLAIVSLPCIPWRTTPKWNYTFVDQEAVKESRRDEERNRERERKTRKQERKVKVNRSTFFHIYSICLFLLHIFFFFTFCLSLSLSLSVQSLPAARSSSRRSGSSTSTKIPPEKSQQNPQVKSWHWGCSPSKKKKRFMNSIA